MQDPPVIHRDLKPANIFVRGRTCILGDFGLKKELLLQDIADGDAIKLSEGPGMPKRFRTPELVRYFNKEDNVDLAKSDIFQLGLTLAILFTGRNPLVPVEDYGEPIVLENIGKIEAGEVAAGINGLLSKMLALTPTRRPTPKSLVKSWSKVLRAVVESKSYLQPHVFVRGGEKM
jgi:serine/threonine protein kinase